MNQLSRISSMVKNKITLLGAGPMSKTSIDAIIQLAQNTKYPIAIIPSRRQIECAELGGGYVENWSTEIFSQYIRQHDFKNNILLSRDHCGPWQLEKKKLDGTFYSLEEEMELVKISLKADIQADFDVIHIDPSLGLRHGLNSKEVIQVAIEMLSYCESVKRKDLIYEVGTEEQYFAATEITSAEENLIGILKLISKSKLPKPSFYVQQTGTKVLELRNVGSFDAEIDSKGILPTSYQINKIVKICERNGVWLKEHNADYLSDNALEWHRRFGIHGANVAPEFGVVETKTIVNLAKKIGAEDLINLMVSKIVDGQKWKKWMIEESSATDYDKMLIAGHYHFTEDWFIELRNELRKLLALKSINLDKIVFEEVKQSVNRYLKSFGYYGD